MSGGSSPPIIGKLKALSRIHLKGTYCRMVRAEDADAILSTGPSFRYGGRYNRAGEFGALYLSESPVIGEQEKLKQVANNPDLLPPQVIGAVEADIRDVLDLTDAANQKALGLPKVQLADPLDLTVPQSIADAARAIGIGALLVPSAVADGRNLVVFEERLTQPSCKVKVMETQKWSAK